MFNVLYNQSSIEIKRKKNLKKNYIKAFESNITVMLLSYSSIITITQNETRKIET